MGMALTRLSGRRRARLHRAAREAARAHADDAALPRRERAERARRRDRLQGLLLPLPRHGDAAGASGSASCRPSTRRSCSPACSPPPRTSTATTATRPRSARLARTLYGRVDWAWMLDGGDTLCHGWRPEQRLPPVPLGGLRRGAAPLPARPRLADASDPAGELRRLVPHLRVEDDLRPRATSTPARSSPTSSRTSGSTSAASATPSCASTARDYFENSRRATYVQQQYAIRNPRRLRARRRALLGRHGQRRARAGRRGRSTASSASSSTTSRAACPFGPDDGTVAPWAVVASLPFAPEIVAADDRATSRALDAARAPTRTASRRRSTRPSRCDGDDGIGWVSPYHFGIDQGPMVLMIENYRSGLVWALMRDAAARRRAARGRLRAAAGSRRQVARRRDRE